MRTSFTLQMEVTLFGKSEQNPTKYMQVILMEAMFSPGADKSQWFFTRVLKLTWSQQGQNPCQKREREREMGELRTSSLHNDEGKAPQLV